MTYFAQAEIVSEVQSRGAWWVTTDVDTISGRVTGAAVATRGADGGRFMLVCGHGASFFHWLIMVDFPGARPAEPGRPWRPVAVTIINSGGKPLEFEGQSSNFGASVTIVNYGVAHALYEIFPYARDFTFRVSDRTETFAARDFASAGSLWKNACDRIAH